MDLNQIKFHFDVGGETCKSFLSLSVKIHFVGELWKNS